MTTMTKLGELTGDYALDTARTRLGFVARHAMSTRVRGRFDEFEGSARLDGDDPSKSGVALTIGARSIQTRNRQRDDQLRGKFLDVDGHPTIAFVSTRVKQVDGTTFQVTGDLTIRGVTRPVTVDVELAGAEHDPRGDVRIAFTGSATINRKDWGVNWNAATGVLISDKVTLEFDVTAIRRSS
ncbi:YceI family protein [Nonomuraea sp. NPDC003754]